MDEEQLKRWIKENLLLEVKYANPSGSDQSVIISLRVVGDRDSFSYEYIHIDS